MFRLSIFVHVNTLNYLMDLTFVSFFSTTNGPSAKKVPIFLQKCTYWRKLFKSYDNHSFLANTHIKMAGMNVDIPYSIQFHKRVIIVYFLYDHWTNSKEFWRKYDLWFSKLTENLRYFSEIFANFVFEYSQMDDYWTAHFPVKHQPKSTLFFVLSTRVHSYVIRNIN